MLERDRITDKLSFELGIIKGLGHLQLELLAAQNKMLLAEKPSVLLFYETLNKAI